MCPDTLAVPPSAALVLRHATQDTHRLVETVPLMQALGQGQVDRAAYALILRRHHALLAGFEAQLSDWLSTLIGAGWQYRRRVPALREDLHTLGSRRRRPSRRLPPATMPRAGACSTSSKARNSAGE